MTEPSVDAPLVAQPLELAVRGRARLLVPTVLGLVLVAGGVTILTLGVLPQSRAQAVLATAARARLAERPRVPVIRAAAAPGATTVALPARIEAAQEALLYPQASGYLVRNLVDIGDSVTA